jgi:hypothetical protein
MSFEKLNEFVNRLELIKAPYRIRKIREQAILVEVLAPSEHWEIEFLEDGDIEIERYRSGGLIEDESALAQLWRLLEDSPSERSGLSARDH